MTITEGRSVAPRGLGLERKASLNAVASGIDYVVRLVVEFVLNPILLSGLGSSLYGAWRVIWRMTGYLWATGGRSAQALQSALANRLLSDDYDEKRRFVFAAVLVWALFIPLLVVVASLTVWLLPYALHTPRSELASVRWAIAVLGFDSVLISIVAVPRAVLQGENLGYRRMGLSAIIVVASGLMTAGVVWLGGGIIGVAVAHVASTILAGIVLYGVARKHVPWFGAARPTRTEVKKFAGLSGWFMVWKLVNQLMLAGDVVILAAFASVELVSTYTLSKFVAEAMLPLMATLIMGGMPGLGGIIGARQYDRARSVRAEVMTMSWIVALAAAAAIVMWNEAFVRLWVGGSYAVSTTTTLLIVIAQLQLVLIRNDAFVIDLTLDVKAKVLVGLGSSIIALAIGAVLVGAFDLGVAGLCIGLLCGRSVLTVVYPLLVGRTIGHSLLDQFRSALRPVACTAALLALSATAASNVRTQSWIVLVPGSIATGAAVLAAAAFLGLNAADRHRLQRRVVRMSKVVRR